MKKVSLIVAILCGMLLGALTSIAAEPGADQLGKPAETKETKKPVIKRLTSAERKALFMKLQERQPSDPEVLAERLNNALKAEQPSRGTPFPREITKS